MSILTEHFYTLHYTSTWTHHTESRTSGSFYIEEKWFLLVYKILAVICLSRNIDAHVALQVIKLITKQKVKVMGKMLNGFAAITLKYGNIYRAF